MKKVIDNINVNYEYTNIKSDITIVLLHGWGQNIEMMKPIGDKYKDKFNVLIIDLPGFGESDEPKTPWTVYEYADFIHNFIESLEIKKIYLIGHSFGGKISLVYSSKYKVEKLVCLASPYCKETKKLSLKTRFYKFVKKIKLLTPLANYMKNKLGSTDYKNASEIMKGVLVQSVNLDIDEDVKKIKCPTLLVWGTADTAVPINRAYELEKMIDNAGVVVYEGATHYAYLERLNNLIKVLNSFFNC